MEHRRAADDGPGKEKMGKCLCKSTAHALP